MDPNEKYPNARKHTIGRVRSPGCCGIQSSSLGTKPGIAAASCGSQAGNGTELAGAWAEQVTISLKGDQKQERFQVRVGRDGKQQKTSLDPPANAQPEGGRLKKRIVEKKKEEYKDYADQMKTLARQYVPPEKDKLQQAYQQGNITMGSVPKNPNAVELVINNYLKQGDALTLIFDRAQKELLQVQIASYNW